MSTSTYFNKHYDASMQKPFHVSEGHLSVATELKENHFDSNAPSSSLVEVQSQNPDQILNEEDVDENMFIFPDKANANGVGD